MDARERLRAYLEQRRELGEAELVLDALSTEDVLRMVGAMPRGSAAAAPDAARTRWVTPPATEVPTRPERQADAADVRPVASDAPPVADEVTSGGPPPSADWRAVLAASGGAPRRAGVPPTPPPAAATPDNNTAEPAPAPARAAAALPAKRWRIVGVEYAAGLRVERPPMLAMEGPYASLDAVAAAVAGCQACALHATATRPVPGVGNPAAEVMVVGEAPGEQEDRQGEPFVGPAGQLLTKILEAIALQREAVFICNVLKHRPPGNRNPLPEEVRACAPFLQAQVDLVQPKLLLAFGTFAAQTLLNTKLPIGKLRQQVHAYQGIPLIATYHPAALLRNDAWKRPTWEDMKLARRILDATVRA